MSDPVPEQAHDMPTAEAAAFAGQEDQVIEDAGTEEFYQVTINLPENTGKVQVIASPHEAIQDVRQSIVESTETCIHSCFSLAFNGVKLNDFMELGDVDGITPDAELDLVLDNYTEREARIHINRLRDLLAGPTKQSVNAVGLDPGLSFLSTVGGHVEEQPIDPATLETAPTTVFSSFDLEASAPLSGFVPKGLERSPVQCVKSIALSGWNPPPPPLKLRGDLLYLIVTTLEGETVHITSSVTGFHVNKSTSNHFDPHPRTDSKAASHHSLIVLLEKISPMFATNFKKLQDQITRYHMLEVLPITTVQPAYPWAVQPQHHTFDPTRPAEAYLNYGTDSVDSLRDWNEEIQSHRELPRSTLQERVTRDRFLNKIYADFAEAAVRGAMDVVNGNVVPLNPLEPTESHMYVYNNIFYSKGFDGRNTFENLGGDEAAHVATGKDLEGVRSLSGVDVEGLYTLGTVVVDYKGTRVVAQSIVPGIFRQQEESSIVYGSIDNGPVVRSDEKFHELLGQAAKALHLAEHAVEDGEGKGVNLWTSFDTKGLLGADGRRYLLDLYRLNPVDVEFLEKDVPAKDDMPEYPHKLTLLRPELIVFFWETRLRQWVQERAREIQQRAEEKKAKEDEADKSKEANQEEKKDIKDEANGTATADHDDSAATPEEDVNLLDFDLSFNVDAFTATNTPADCQDKKTEQENLVREAAKFLRDNVIAVLLQDFLAYVVKPIDGGSLTKAMHRRGINMRYLGRIARLAQESNEPALEHIHYLAMQEMVVRAVKRILRRLIRPIPSTHVPDCVAHVLNCLLGHAFNPKPTATFAGDGHEYANLTPESLREKIEDEVLLRYRFRLPEGFVKDLPAEKKIPVLREVCLRAGIQVEARDYLFAPTAVAGEAPSANEAVPAPAATSKKGKQQQQQQQQQDKNARKATKTKKRMVTFEPSDVQTILPMVKQATNRFVYADEAFEAGKTSLAQGHRQLGLELLMESLALHEQTYGFLHPETARCYQALAMIYYSSEDKDLALDFQRKAVIVNERTLGVDSPEALHSYLNLGLFENAAGRTQTALKFMKHAIQYWDLIYGKDHPDSATSDNNIAVMLQSLRNFDVSCKFFERAKATQVKAHGADHMVVANSHHLVAKAYALKGEFDASVQEQQRAYDIFLAQAGEEDVRTKEAEMWLQELKNTAEFAAQQALYEKNKHLHQQQQAQLQYQQQHQHQHGPGKVSSLSAAAAAASAKAALAEAAIRAANAEAQVGSKGHLPVDELLEFINNPKAGASSKSKKAKGGKRSNKK